MTTSRELNEECEGFQPIPEFPDRNSEGGGSDEELTPEEMQRELASVLADLRANSDVGGTRDGGVDVADFGGQEAVGAYAQSSGDPYMGPGDAAARPVKHEKVLEPKCEDCGLHPCWFGAQCNRGNNRCKFCHCKVPRGPDPPPRHAKGRRRKGRRKEGGDGERDDDTFSEITEASVLQPGAEQTRLAATQQPHSQWHARPWHLHAAPPRLAQPRQWPQQSPQWQQQQIPQAYVQHWETDPYWGHEQYGSQEPCPYTYWDHPDRPAPSWNLQEQTPPYYNEPLQ